LDADDDELVDEDEDEAGLSSRRGFLADVEEDGERLRLLLLRSGRRLRFSEWKGEEC
jgi:hypothetical protein